MNHEEKSVFLVCRRRVRAVFSFWITMTIDTEHEWKTVSSFIGVFEGEPNCEVGEADWEHGIKGLCCSSS